MMPGLSPGPQAWAKRAPAERAGKARVGGAGARGKRAFQAVSHLDTPRRLDYYLRSRLRLG